MVLATTLETALEAMAFGAGGLVHVWRDEIVAEADARCSVEADILVFPTRSVMASPDGSPREPDAPDWFVDVCPGFRR